MLMLALFPEPEEKVGSSTNACPSSDLVFYLSHCRIAVAAYLHLGVLESRIACANYRQRSVAYSLASHDARPGHIVRGVTCLSLLRSLLPRSAAGTGIVGDD